MSHLLFILILGILTFNYLFGLLLDYLDSTRWSNQLPQALLGIYDTEKYRTAQDYEKTNTRFSLWTGALSFLSMLLMLLLGGFAWLDEFVRTYSQQPIWMALLFFAILGLASDLLAMPFSIYHTFVIEQKFGMNTTTPRTYILDKIKSWLLAGVLGGGILAFVVWIYGATGSWFWIVAWGSLTGFSLFMSLFYSNLIVPLFNKQKPLEAGELRDAIQAFASLTGFKLKNVFVIDGSKRSLKANAYFTGFGPKKRIVLYDTLISKLSTQEIVAVLAHEIGHYKKKHIIYGMLTSILSSGFILYIMSLCIGMPDISAALGATLPSFHIGIIAFSMLYSPISMIVGIAGSYVSRRNEYAADSFAAHHQQGEALKSGLIKLSVLNLSNLQPHPFTVRVSYSHPTLLQRIEAIETNPPHS